MIRKRLLLLSAVAMTMAGAIGAAHAEAAAPAAADAGPTATGWDNLVRVKSKNLKLVYLLPGADFREYTKVMLDPAEVDFVKGWVRKMNSTYDFNMGRTTDADAAKIAAAFRKGIDQIFTKAFTKGGYQIVTEPGPDVLRVSIAIFNLSISAPNTVTSGQSSVRTVDAGSASILIEARDSESGQVLGRAMDAQLAGINNQFMARSITTNQADFGRMGERWADYAVKGLGELKAASPVDQSAQPIPAKK
jgi:Protein of unknown function (DUF3313)